jgi:hypothetical protein
MRTRNLLLACGIAIILIGVSAAITFSLAQANDEQMEAYEGTDREYLSFDQIDHITHDIELPETMDFCGEEVHSTCFMFAKDWSAKFWSTRIGILLRYYY